jgi:phosphoribosyl 1,2-cyclic phosphodiesterase
VALTIYGVRGSTPVGGRETDRYGGRTICVGADLGDGQVLVLDCGTGLHNLQQALPERADGYTFSVFMTHYHWDHLQGLPFFRPLYDPKNRFVFYGYPWEDLDVEALIAGTFQPPWFPVSLHDAAAPKQFVALGDTPIELGPVTVSWTRLKHPQGVTAYRVTGPNASVAIATDHESGDPEFDAALVDLARDADVLVHDAQYTDGEYQLHYEGWGHSTWTHAVEAAEEAGVPRLVLISHDPDHTDDMVDTIVALARNRFPGAEGAYQGMTLPL